MATPTPTYSQERTVQAITSYYKFLEKTYPYIQPGTVRYPPEGGWPTITRETLAPLHKTDTVVSLLRHIPYWRHSSGDYFCIAQKTWPLEYNNPDVQRPTGGVHHTQGQGQDLNVRGVDDDGPDWWKGEPTFEVGAFFEMLKEKFHSLEWMPHPFGHTDVWEADDDEDDIDENTVALKKIMRDAGWPGDGEGGHWNKDQAATEMDKREEEVEWM